MSKGIWYAIGAYAVWGLFPIYWKWLHEVSALQLIAHRVTWSCLLLLAVVLVSRQWSTFKTSLKSFRNVLIYSLAGVLIAINWLIYVWAVNQGLIVETSLGYFINPLVTILLGVFVLGERLRLGQWIPIGLAAAGVAWLAFVYGALPWISLALACTFGLYGLVKKMAPLNAVQGLAMETLVLFVPAVLFLAYEDFRGTASFGHGPAVSDFLMMGSGIVTTVPLLLFAGATRRVPLTTIGLIQYISPTIQFLLGVFMFHEPFTRSRFLGFALVWLALMVSAFEGVLTSTRAAARARVR